MAIKVMLADDHELFRVGLKLILEKNDNISVVEQAADGIECLDVLEKNSNLDIIILDINMPNMNGIVVLPEIRKLYPNIRVMVLTNSNDTNFLIRALDFGISGYLTKDVNIAILYKAIEDIYNGKEYIQENLIPIVDNRILNRDIDLEKINNLTKREIEILKQIAGGRFNKEIADYLNITERTVKNHISNLFKKIDVNDRTQAAVFAIRNNLVNLY